MTFRMLGFAIASLALTPAAMAASDLSVDVTSTQNVDVYDTTTFSVKVRNIGNKNASNVTLNIQLPETHTSPNVYVLGDLGAVTGGCTQSGTELNCNLYTINKGKNKSVSFELDLPVSAISIDVVATASTTSNENTTANNSDTESASQVFFDTPISGPRAAHNRHCTGQNLISFFECELFPSSISSHDIVLEANGSVSFPGQVGYGGSWSQASDDHLTFVYTDGTDIVADFEGWGVGGDCFEGITLFPGSPYMAPYEVCLQ